MDNFSGRYVLAAADPLDETKPENGDLNQEAKAKRFYNDGGTLWIHPGDQVLMPTGVEGKFVKMDLDGIGDRDAVQYQRHCQIGPFWDSQGNKWAKKTKSTEPAIDIMMDARSPPGSAAANSALPALPVTPTRRR